MARPRSEQARNAALDATVEVLIDLGIEGVTWDEVALRSGVAKTTLYRHFETRDGLIEAAIRSCQVDYVTPDTGSLADDLRFILDHATNTPEERRLNDLLPIVIDIARRETQFEELKAEIIELRRRPVRTVLQLAQLRGEVSTDLDLDDAFAMIIGPFTFKRLVENSAVDPEFKDLVITWATNALKATVPAPV